MFPGLYRPGLIEAMSPCVTSTAMRGFRGFTAPASLKRFGFPGLLPLRPRFRGFTAPASLKQSVAVRMGAGDA